jgi:tetratricopeptide (TPR) repeat protein
MRALEGVHAARHAHEVEWVRAYVLAAAGDFRRAEALARSLLDVDDAAVAARAAATLGSVLRQTGRHSEARKIEQSAARRALTAELRSHLRIGLVADAVGLGDLPAVDRALERVGPVRGWRARVRLEWVRCERELLAGRPAIATVHARRAQRLAAGAHARRHEAKSLLFLGVSLRGEANGLEGAAARAAVREAERSLRRARASAERLGAAPIADVASKLLG